MTVSLIRSLVTLRIDFSERIEKKQAKKLFRQIDGYLCDVLKSGIRTESSISSLTVAGVPLEKADELVRDIRIMVRCIEM